MLVNLGCREYKWYAIYIFFAHHDPEYTHNFKSVISLPLPLPPSLPPSLPSSLTRKVPQRPVHNRLDVLLAQVVIDRGMADLLPLMVGNQAVLREGVIEVLEDALAELFFLLWEVRATHHANGDFFPEFLDECGGVGGYVFAGRGERAIHVEEGDDAGVGGRHSSESRAGCESGARQRGG